MKKKTEILSMVVCMLYSQSIAIIWHSISLDMSDDITEILSDSEVKELYFVIWHFFSSDSA